MIVVSHQILMLGMCTEWAKKLHTVFVVITLSTLNNFS